MKVLQNQFTAYVFDNQSELTPEEQELLQTAATFTKNAYAPYSQFMVGAALRLDNGQIIGGANQENASFPLCICAEQAALSHFGSNYPDQKITQIAITATSKKSALDHPVSPCGSCRQVLCEYESRQNQAIEIILQGNGGPIFKINSAHDLLPLSFDGSIL
ncbi:MAG: cytidine deaminase [Saprospiraceae bacterium]|nr:cytidine deaminase [Saprospiraceae bacterium]